MGGRFYEPSRERVAWSIVVTGIGIFLGLAGLMFGSTGTWITGLVLAVVGLFDSALESARLEHWKFVQQRHAEKVQTLEAELRGQHTSGDTPPRRTRAAPIDAPRT